MKPSKLKLTSYLILVFLGLISLFWLATSQNLTLPAIVFGLGLLVVLFFRTSYRISLLATLLAVVWLVIKLIQNAKPETLFQVSYLIFCFLILAFISFLLNDFLDRIKIQDKRIAVNWKSLKNVVSRLLLKNTRTDFLILLATVFGLVAKIWTGLSLGTFLFLLGLTILFLLKIKVKAILAFSLSLLGIALVLNILSYENAANQIASLFFLAFFYVVLVGFKLIVFKHYNWQSISLDKLNISPFVCLAVLFTVNIFLFWPIIGASGLPQTGDLLTTLNNQAYGFNRIYYLWEDNGSFSRLGANNSTYLIWLTPLASLVKLINISIGQAIRLLIITPSFIALASFFYLSRETLRKIVDNNLSRNLLAIFGALLFTYNPWALARIVHLTHYHAYAFFPLGFLLLIKTFQQPSLARLLGVALVINLISISPHFFVYFFILAIIYLLTLPRHKFKVNLLTSLKLGALVILMGSFWIWPFLKSSANENELIAPGYVLRQMDIKPAGYTLPEYLGLNGRLPNSKLLKFGREYFIILLVLSLIVSTFLSRGNQAIKATGIIALLTALFLIAGARAPTLYHWLIFSSPLSSLSWLLREPFRLAGILAFGYSLGLPFLLAKAVDHLRQKNYALIATLSLTPFFVLIVWNFVN